MRGVTFVLCLMVALFLVIFAASYANAHEGIVPHPPKGKGEHCVRDTDFMRRYHMLMLKHQRDETVHEGVRGNDFSLKGCIDCHAVKGADGQPVSYESPKHFCRSCHDYAAVSLDCFECHASQPGAKPQSGQAETGRTSSAAVPNGAQAAQSAVAQLENYLRENHP